MPRLRDKGLLEGVKDEGKTSLVKSADVDEEPRLRDEVFFFV